MVVSVSISIGMGVRASMVDPCRSRASDRASIMRDLPAAIRAANLAGPRHSTLGRVRSWECVQPCWIIAAVLSWVPLRFSLRPPWPVSRRQRRDRPRTFLPADAAARSRQRSGSCVGASRAGRWGAFGSVRSLAEARRQAAGGHPHRDLAMRCQRALSPPRRFRAGRDRSRLPGLRSYRERRRGRYRFLTIRPVPYRGAHRIFTSPCIGRPRALRHPALCGWRSGQRGGFPVSQDPGGAPGAGDGAFEGGELGAPLQARWDVVLDAA